MTPNFTPLIDALADAPLLKNELCRVFHGRGHSVEALSHINLDFYPPSLFLVSYDEIDEPTLSELTSVRVGKQNHQLNGFDKGVSFLPHDILKSFGKLKKAAPFDLIIVDPPSFQKGSFILTKDYQKVLRRLPELLSDTTQLLLCANSPELSEEAFKALIIEHTEGAIEFVERLAATERFIEVDRDRSLKALVYKTSQTVA